MGGTQLPLAAHTHTPDLQRGREGQIPPSGRWVALSSLTLSPAEVLLILDGIGQRCHHFLLL